MFGLAPFIINTNEKIPAADVSQELEIANNEKLNNDFHFYWKDKELKDIKQVYLTIWNDGKKFIDYSDFTKDSPITLKPTSKDVEIYDVKITKLSRAEIKVNYKKALIDSIEAVQFSFIGDEALEKMDGFEARITYSSDSAAIWNVDGRVKGARNGVGFEIISLEAKEKSKLTPYISILLLIIVVVRVIISIKKTKAIYLKNWEVVFIIAYIITVYVIPFFMTNYRDFS